MLGSNGDCATAQVLDTVDWIFRTTPKRDLDIMALRRRH